MQGALLRTAAAVVLAAVYVSAQAAEKSVSQEIAIKQWVSESRYQTDALGGRPYLLVFWATWCPTCVKSMPEIKELYDKYGAQGLRVLGLSVDKEPSAVVSYIKDNDVPYPVAIDNDTDKKYESKWIPAAYLVDAAGYVVWRGLPDKDELDEAIKKVLEQSPKPVLADIDFSPFSGGQQVEEGKSFTAVFRKLKALSSRDNPLKDDAQGIIDTIDERLEALMLFAADIEKRQNYDSACNIYMAIVKNYGGTDAARAAGEKVRELKQKNKPQK